MTQFYWLLLFCGILLSSLGGILLKMGSIHIDYSNGVVTSVMAIISNWKIILGLSFYFIPAMIWIYMLKKVEISFLQPLFCLTYIITPILAYFFFQETLSIAKWAGIVVIILGISIFAVG